MATKSNGIGRMWDAMNPSRSGGSSGGGVLPFPAFDPSSYRQPVQEVIPEPIQEIAPEPIAQPVQSPAPIQALEVVASGIETQIYQVAVQLQALTQATQNQPDLTPVLSEISKIQSRIVQQMQGFSAALMAKNADKWVMEIEARDEKGFIKRVSMRQGSEERVM